MKNTFKIVLGLLAIGLVSCDAEFETAVSDEGFYDSGSADLSRYVAVGNSLTAGYADGSLYLSGQENSYPNIMAQQFAFAGGGDFTQPLVNDNFGGLLSNGTPIPGFGTRFVLSVDDQGNRAPVRLDEMPTTDISNVLPGPFNNMGVPGAKSFHLSTPGYATLNPYFTRFATSTSTTVIADAAAMNPTFFTLWIGNNDILSFATSGGTGVDQTGNFDPSTYGPNDITDPNVFAAAYSGQVDALTANGADGVLLNIADVTSIPYFTTVPFAPLSPLDPNFGPQIPTLNATFTPLNQAFAFLGVPERSIVFSQTAASSLVIHDEGLADLSAQLAAVLVGGGLDPVTAGLYGQQFGQARQANAGDLPVLVSSGVIGKLNQGRFDALVAAGVPPATAGQLSVNGVTYPMEDQFVLVPVEQQMIATAAAAYNATIQAIADAKDLGFVDAKANLAQVANGGVVYDGGVLTSTFGTGGAFSLDGVHPTPRGYAYVSNLIINEMNRKYNAHIPTVLISDYATITAANNN
ncbi:SGNH/GDSL hydrolase family protein [Ulvibacter antarcticus]|uniref:GDSL-like lipase/acylhydrolase family protein n=1 Tax=Ulvibacter antarcticus TaxID=442714 RepID=A0A3L9YC35_9FLAO|nr:G-D-S-L family lipolytic protein [Ulvibacter antarcticus]RMA56669.1 hypothetical protein BXY75_3375 [Ulvibacter antarcticus]